MDNEHFCSFLFSPRFDVTYGSVN